MFSKKYVFETRQTRTRRVFRNVFLVFLFFLVSASLLTVYLPIYAQKQREVAQKTFYQKAPDLIAVFTGDSGRIDYALKLAEKYPSAKLFITGVYVKNNLKTLLLKQGKGISVEDYIEQQSHHIEIDYLARNTIENGITTLHFAQKTPGVNDILIISNDYHILRIKLIMQMLQGTSQKMSFRFDGIETDYTSWRNVKILFKEVYKLFKTCAFLFFWDKDSTLG